MVPQPPAKSNSSAPAGHKESRRRARAPRLALHNRQRSAVNKAVFCISFVF